MSIYINKNNQQLGPFEEAKVREMLRTGELSPGDSAIRRGEQHWQKLGAMFPNAAPSAASAPPAAAPAPAVQTAPPTPVSAAPKKSRKKLLYGCGGFFLFLILVGGVLGILAYRNLNPADSKEDLPDAVKDFKLGSRYPPKGNVWGTETMFTGIYSDATKTKTIIYLMTVYASESQAQDALRLELTRSCKTGESPMYFNFIKNGANVSEGATCAVPLLVRKDNKLVMLGGGGAQVADFIEFAENLPFNGGAEMKRK